MSRRVVGAVIAVASAAIALTACSGSTGTHTHSGPPSSSSASTSASPTPAPSSPEPSSTVTTPAPEGTAAVAAYTAFAVASRAAEERPGDQQRFTTIKAHAVDPALANEGLTLFNYQRANIAFIGKPPTPRVRVEQVDAAAKPYPTATVVDCPANSATWKAYDTKTHKVVPITYPGQTAKPPHATTAQLIYYGGRWAVQTITTDVRHTCAA